MLTSRRLCAALVLAAICSAPALACEPEGKWFYRYVSGEDSQLTLNDDGSYEWRGIKGTWKPDGSRMSGKLTFTPKGGEDDRPVTYTFALAWNGSWDKETLTLSGGNLSETMVFYRTARAPEKKPQIVNDGVQAKATDPLPVNVVASSKKGDWIVLSRQGEARVYRIDSVVEDKVNVTVGTNGTAPKDKPLTLKTKDSTILDLLAQDLAGTKVTAMTTTDEKREAGGREVACKKVTVETEKGETFTVWLSSEAKGFGLVALAHKVGDKTALFELAGRGNGDTLEWGKRPAELAPERAER